MLLLPASRASSTNASCKDQGIGSVIAAHDQVAFGIKPGRGALNQPVGLMHYHPPSRRIAGPAREQRQDRVLVLARNRVYRTQQASENRLARKRPSLVDAQ